MGDIWLVAGGFVQWSCADRWGRIALSFVVVAKVIPLVRYILVLRMLGAAVLVSALAMPVWALETARIQIIGGGETLRADLRAASLLAAIADAPNAPQAVDVIAAANADYGRLLRVLYAGGYFGAVIRIQLDGRDADQISPFNTPDIVRRAQVRVETGRPYRFGNVAISPLAPGTELPEDFKPGAIARGPKLQEALDAAVLAWRRAGRAKVSIAGQNVVANHPSRRLDADVRLNPGAVIAFGQLRQAGSSTVRPRRIEQIAGLPTGARYSPDTLDDVARRLRRTGTFSSVTLSEADELSPDNLMDVTVDLTDAKPRKLGFGAELSSFEGVRLSGYWLHRNFFGGAERLRFDAEISGIGGQSGGIDYDIAARLERPAVFGPDTNVFTFLELGYEDEPSYETRTGNIGLGVSRIFGRRLQGDASAAFRFSETRDVFGTRGFSVFALPGNLEWDNRDQALKPTTGAFAALGVTPFINLDGTGAGANVNLDLRGYRNLAPGGGVVLAGRAQVGATFGPNLANVPPEFLYYSGGGGSVRGQPYQSLGISQGSGRQSGGTGFLGASTELRFDLENGFGVVGFADAGFIGDTDFSTNNGDWHAGAGLGLRYDTGLGPIRVDLAVPVAGRTGQGMQLYIGIGQAF